MELVNYINYAMKSLLKNPMLELLYYPKKSRQLFEKFNSINSKIK